MSRAPNKASDVEASNTETSDIEAYDIKASRIEVSDIDPYGTETANTEISWIEALAVRSNACIRSMAVRERSSC